MSPIIPPIVGYVDRLGYIICTKCLGASEPPKYDALGPAAKYADDSSLDGESCDRCRKPFVEGPPPRRWRST